MPENQDPPVEPTPSEPQAGVPEVPEPVVDPNLDPNLPEYSQGKDRAALVGIIENLRTSVTAAAPAPAPQPQVQPQVADPTSSNGVGISPDDIYSDTPAFVRSIEDYTNAKVEAGISAAATPLLTPLVGMAKTASQTEKNKEVWDAYGPEIDTEMAKIPLQSRADPAIWNQAVDMIAGRHRDELAHKAAERIVASGGDAGMITSGGITAANGDGIAASPIRTLFNDNDPSIKAFKDEGMTAATVIDHAAKMGHAEEVYAEMLKSKTSRRYSTVGTPS